MKTIFAKCLAPALLLGTLFVPLVAHADGSGRNYTINGRLENQQDRIYQGVRSDRLNGGQFERLEGRDSRTQRQEVFDRRHDDGRLTSGERFQLNRELNRTSVAIYRDKHDGCN